MSHGQLVTRPAGPTPVPPAAARLVAQAPKPEKGLSEPRRAVPLSGPVRHRQLRRPARVISNTSCQYRAGRLTPRFHSRSDFPVDGPAGSTEPQQNRHRSQDRGLTARRSPGARSPPVARGPGLAGWGRAARTFSAVPPETSRRLGRASDGPRFGVQGPGECSHDRGQRRRSVRRSPGRRDVPTPRGVRAGVLAQGKGP